ncbi:MAG TPA: YggS family pyridoxal phosphate-dependent enzyme [Candidatus Limnocylindrales bacterium]|nr:YggS family pyridoxal phosphate-dependent enzyme [Candidatus Limnocylindrales bacterium]
MSADEASIVDARRRVLEEIAAAARRAGRDPTNVRLVAVTKQVPPERVAAALAAGCEDLGENRVQEAAAKIPLVGAAAGGGPARWHLIGPLQSNKARRAVELFDVLEAVDTLDLALRLDRLAHELRPGRPLPVLLQVNVDADPAKAGFSPAALERDLPVILDLPDLRVDGLMTVGRLVTDAEHARPTFVALRTLSKRMRAIHPALGPDLSMGMSDDFAVAVEEGATIVRIGRALFGERHS